MKLFSKGSEIDDVLRTDQAKVNYLKGLARVALADGSTDLSEAGYFNEIAANIGLAPAAVENVEALWDSYSYVAIHFDTQREKIYFLMQAFFLAWADSDLSDSEIQEIQNMAIELGIDDILFKKIEDWVSEGVKWMNEGSELLEV